MLDQITDRKEEVIEAAEVLIKYQGYIDRERMIAEKIHRLEAIRIKGKFDYNSLIFALNRSPAETDEDRSRNIGPSQPHTGYLS